MGRVLGTPCSICETFIANNLFRSTVNYEETVTIVTEIEGIINCRPLTYIYNDNTEEVVTPSHLIYGRRLLSKPSNDKPDNFNLENLTRRMKYLHTLIQHYWNRWKLEYLNELREYHRCGKEDTRINVGDIVLVEILLSNEAIGN